MGMLKQLLAEDSGTKFMSELKWLVVILMSIAGSLCILYAIYIGYLFATATDDGKRRAAKDRLIKVISSGLIIFALATCLNVIDLKFETPNNGESSNGGDDPFAGLEQSGGTCLFTYVNAKTTYNVSSEKSFSFTLTYNNNITYRGKEIDPSLFGGFVNFSFSEAGIGSMFENDYGKDKDLYPNETNEQLNVSTDGKSLTYYYRARSHHDGAKINYWTLSKYNGKYWEGKILFLYNGEVNTALCYIRINDANYRWGDKIAEAM